MMHMYCTEWALQSNSSRIRSALSAKCLVTL
eukprot:COSAG03_NODE_22806_length_286_cov_1.663102_1_plen_30_part_10